MMLLRLREVAVCIVGSPYTKAISELWKTRHLAFEIFQLRSSASWQERQTSKSPRTRLWFGKQISMTLQTCVCCNLIKVPALGLEGYISFCIVILLIIMRKNYVLWAYPVPRPAYIRCWAQTSRCPYRRETREQERQGIAVWAYLPYCLTFGLIR